MVSPSPPSPEDDHTSHNDNKPTPFRFKRKRQHTSTDEEPEQRKHHHRHHHHRHHHHHSRRYPSPPPTPDSACPLHSKWSHPPDPDTAFRESLFDALADDEGAAFWEGVYGQPVHTYSRFYPAGDDDELDENGEKKLERMTDEEYVAHVRSKMWEKSHGYIMEERRRREQERAKRKEKDVEGRRFQVEVEEALRKGEVRRRKARWKGVWEGYLKAWERQGSGDSNGKEGIVWPVESGKAEDVDKESVEGFYNHAHRAAADESLQLAEILKKERVKWHPDRFQQRAGSQGLDTQTMKRVTAVFQTIDSMWTDLKGK